MIDMPLCIKQFFPFLIFLSLRVFTFPFIQSRLQLSSLLNSIFQFFRIAAKLLIIFHFLHRLIFLNEDKTVFFACAP